MNELLGPTIKLKDFKQQMTQRKKKYIEKTIEGKNKQILEQKSKLEEDDGWQILRRNKNSYRLKKEKPISEYLEDKIWVILSKMGFTEMSLGRNFTISVGDKLNQRQIDVFAKDSETAIFIECTTSEKPIKKDLSPLIQKIQSIMPNIYKSLREHYIGEKLKVKWVIATENIEWGNADLKKAEKAKIHVIRDNEVEYYSKLTSHLKLASKYQFLSDLFSQEQIKALDLIVPATKGTMGKKTFYNFLIKPKDLIKIAFVSHKASRDVERLDTYQRMLKPKRLKEIAEYVNNGGQFPTNIVVNLKSKRNIRFDSKQKIGNSEFGILHLPRTYSSCWIIDGQHRLYGFMQSDRAKLDHDKTTFPVLAYANMKPSKEASLFVDINCKQVRVTRRLLNELYANLTWDSEDFDERMLALSSRIATSLDIQKDSPIYDRVILTNKDKTKYRCLTITSFCDGLKENKFFGTKNKAGPFIDSRSTDLEKSKIKAVKILKELMNWFATSVPENWKLGDEKGGYLCTNNALRALFKVYKEILDFIEYNKSIDLDTCTAEEVINYTKEYMIPVIEFFQTASADEISLYRSRQALKGVRTNSLYMMHTIHSTYNEFSPNSLKEFMESIDIEGTGEARGMIDEIQARLFDVVIKKLKKKFEDRWWYDGIPKNVRTECTKKHEEEGGIKDKEQYLYLIGYKKIAHSNWELFKDYFSFLEKGGKDKQLKWLDDLNPIRNITHHREKWPATKKQVRLVREIHSKIMAKDSSNSES
jgi:DNA sulfur modification protein DndB